METVFVVVKNCQKQCQDIFGILCSYLESCGLPWKQCFGISTDGAPSVIGSIKVLLPSSKKNIMMP
jgi:hypothetical protein